MKYKFIKTDDGEMVLKNAAHIARKLQALKPGHYTVEISLQDNRLVRMKKFYFSMESHLANHLGMKKRELHSAIQASTAIGRDATGDYESVADIKDCDSMLARIYEFQQWAATHFNYKCEPYNEEHGDERKPHEDSTTGLQPDPHPQ